MAEQGGNEDLKAKMREALERKQANDRGVPKDGPSKEKAHGSEVDRRGRAEDAPAQGRRRGFLTPAGLCSPVWRSGSCSMSGR